jgi:hypothetical protein
MSICLAWLAEYGARLNTVKHLASKRDDMHHFIIKRMLFKKKKKKTINF